MSYLDLYTVNVYCIMIAVLLWAVSLRFYIKCLSLKAMYCIDLILVCVLSAVVASDVSTRPLNIEGDTLAYYQFYMDLLNGIIGPFDKAFVYLSKLLVYFEMTYVVLFWLVPFLLVASYFILCKNLYSVSSLVPLLLVCSVVMFPFFFSLSANVIRQGLAVVMITMCFSSLFNSKKGWAISFFIVAVLFHKSAIIFAPFIVLNQFVLSIKLSRIIKVWALVSLASYFGLFASLSNVVFSQLSLLGLSSNYTDLEDTQYITGFRWDFWFFSSFPVVCLCFDSKVDNSANLKKLFFMKVLAFIGIIHIALLCVAYNDRFGLYGWFYYPILISFIFSAIVANLIRGFRKRQHIATLD